MKSIFKKLRLRFIYRDCLILTDQVHPTAVLGRKVSLAKHVSVGKNTIINDFSYINSYSIVSSAKIGKFCSIGPFCNIGPDSHPIQWISTSPNFYKEYKKNGESGYIEPKEVPIIGNDVWIGSHVVVLRGVKVGDGAVLAAGSIITKDVEPYSIVGGVPAKLLRYRFHTNDVEYILQKNIWSEDFSQEKLKELSEGKNNFIDFL